MSDVAKDRDGLDEKTRRRADGDLAEAIADDLRRSPTPVRWPVTAILHQAPEKAKLSRLNRNIGSESPQD
jgi:hypothetical protein